MKNFIFGENSLLRQAYFQFWISIVLLSLIFLPNWILIKATFILSCWAITISAQSFIAGAQANKKLVTMDQSIVDKMAEDDRIPTESP
jgi:hypothetical protein